MATAESVRKSIEAAKVEVMRLQESGLLGEQSAALSVEAFRALDKAWHAAYKLERARSFGC